MNSESQPLPSSLSFYWNLNTSSHPSVDQRWHLISEKLGFTFIKNVCLVENGFENTLLRKFTCSSSSDIPTSPAVGIGASSCHCDSRLQKIIKRMNHLSKLFCTAVGYSI